MLYTRVENTEILNLTINKQLPTQWQVEEYKLRQLNIMKMQPLKQQLRIRTERKSVS
jgi:hypothetical protein